MTDVLDDSRCSALTSVEGVLVGFRTPQHMQGINVAGYRTFHYRRPSGRGTSG